MGYVGEKGIGYRMHKEGVEALEGWQKSYAKESNVERI